MKIIYMISFLSLMILVSCSDLNLNDLKCNNDSNKCPNNSICYNKTCRICPENSIKSGDACICNDNNLYFYKEKNKCEILTCIPKNGMEISRSVSCQDGLGYCIKKNNNGFCKYNFCTNDTDCNQDEQCTFKIIDDTPQLACQKIGTAQKGKVCSETGTKCSIGLSCLKDNSSGKSICQRLCIPNNNNKTVSCNNNDSCVDFASFKKETPANIIGICLDRS